MNQSDILKDVLKKYKFDKSIPPEVRQRIKKAKKNTLLSIMKEDKKYSLFTLLVLSLYFWIKKFGLSLSVAKSAIVVWIVSIITIAAVVTGTYYSVKIIFLDKTSTIENKTTPQENTEAKVIPPTYEVSIAPFDFDSNIEEIGTMVNNKIKNELMRVKGNSVTVMSNQIKTKKILFGSIIKFGNSYRVSAKIIDRTTSRVIYHVSETAATTDEIDKVCISITKKIAGKI